ncbi:MAG: divalent-cation tolerance protein CutA [Chloroflexi bacterium]|nr:divalent-cation tolerance protein CutA [Chloroflexota bacterium]
MDVEKDFLIVVFITVPGMEEGDSIGKTLVEERLAACVNVLPGITSHYIWEGKLESSPEALLIVKTGANRFEQLRSRVLELHPYNVPEVIAIPIVAGDPGYLDWVRNSLDE